MTGKVMPTSPQVQRLDYLQAFRYFFEDPNWGMNLLLGSVLMLIPIVGPIVLLGWQQRTIQNLVKGDTQPIPRFDFSDFGFYLTKGIIPFLVNLLIMLPFMFLIFLVIFGSVLGIGAMASQALPGEFIAVMVFISVFVVLVVGFFPLILFCMAALTRAFLTEDFSQAFQVGKLTQYSLATWKRVFIAYLILIPLSILMMFVGMLAFYVGMYPVMVIWNFAWIFITWQIYALYLQEGGEPIPMKDPLDPLPSLRPPTGGSSAPAAPTGQTPPPSNN